MCVFILSVNSAEMGKVHSLILVHTPVHKDVGSGFKTLISLSQPFVMSLSCNTLSQVLAPPSETALFLPPSRLMEGPTQLSFSQRLARLQT